MTHSSHRGKSTFREACLFAFVFISVIALLPVYLKPQECKGLIFNFELEQYEMVCKVIPLDAQWQNRLQPGTCHLLLETTNRHRSACLMKVPRYFALKKLSVILN